MPSTASTRPPRKGPICRHFIALNRSSLYWAVDVGCSGFAACFLSAAKENAEIRRRKTKECLQPMGYPPEMETEYYARRHGDVSRRQSSRQRSAIRTQFGP